MVKFVHKTKSDKIVLKGACLQKEEKNGSAVIRPGHLVALSADGTIAVQSGAGSDCRRAVATENSILGGTKDTDYVADTNVFVALCPPGAEVQLRVAANTPEINIGDALMAADDGTVVKHVATATDADVNTIIAYALESVENDTAEEAFILSEIK